MTARHSASVLPASRPTVCWSTISSMLKEHADGERVDGFECRFQCGVAPIGARTAIEVAKHSGCEGRSGVFLREKRDLFTLTLKPRTIVG